ATAGVRDGERRELRRRARPGRRGARSGPDRVPGWPPGRGRHGHRGWRRRARLLRLDIDRQLRVGGRVLSAVRTGSGGLFDFGPHAEGFLPLVSEPDREGPMSTAAELGDGATQQLPEALAEPVRSVRPGWISLLFLANLGLWLAIYAPVQVLLPEQAALFDRSDKTVVLSLVMAVGAVVALIANPIVGAYSDRTTGRWGRRHPWTMAGAVVAALGLLVLAEAPNIVLMTIGWCLVQAGCNGMLAALTS